MGKRLRKKSKRAKKKAWLVEGKQVGALYTVYATNKKAARNKAMRKLSVRICPRNIKQFHPEL